MRRGFWVFVAGFGISMIGLGWTGYQWWNQTHLANQNVSSKNFQETAHAESTENDDEIIYENRPKTGEVFGTIEIPRIDRKVNIVEGSDVPTQEQLAKGVGHHRNSVLPGESDNSILAGHRETAFRNMGELKKGDKLVVTTHKGKFIFQVKRMRIVDDEDRTVVTPREKATLTLYTCYPFDMFGSAPQRYVIEADLSEFKL